MAACGGGGGNPAPAVVPLELEITPTDGAKIKLDGATILPEEQNGNVADGGKPVSLGILTDNKNTNGEAVYKMATGADAAADNADFEITPNGELRYIGSDSGDFETATKKSFAISIARYNSKADADDPNSNPQIVSVTINLQDIEEVLIVTPATDVTYFSTDENGESFLDENTDGSGDGNEKLLGTIIDTIATSAAVSYRLADATSSNDNGNFRIDTATGQIYYTGPALDFESPTDKKQFTLQIIRTLDGNAATEQTLQRTINLKNVNDNDPVLTAEGGTIDGEKLPILADFDSTVANGLAAFKLTFTGIPDSLVGTSFDIVFVWGPRNDPIKLTPVYKTGTNIIEKITISYEPNAGLFGAFIDALKTAFSADDFVLSEYFDDAVKIGGASIFDFQGTSTLTTTPTLKVASGTTEVIADFNGMDKDGDILTYSLSDSTDDNTGDARYFMIDEATGELRFNPAKMPTLTGSQNSDAIYVITVEVSDGTRTATYPIQIEITAASSGSSTASTAAEAVPDTDESAAESTPEAEAAKPSIGRRILDYLFTSQEEHRQMQNQQIDNMFGDTLDDLSPNDPDIL